MIIDAHSHLWLRQDTLVDGHRIYPLGRGRAMFFGEERQMLPPFMLDGVNSAEVFLANMDYAQVGAAVVVQEIIDGCQNDYLSEVSKRWPDRFFCCGMPDFSKDFLSQIVELHQRGFRGIAVPGHRLHFPLTDLVPGLEFMEKEGMILSMCLADDGKQISQMDEVLQELPKLKVAIGHFGMVTGKCWKQQILLARHPEVYIESGGITWLFNDEFYPYKSAVIAVKEAADLVGMDKLMWGSDYPRTICAITYKMSYDFILKSDLLSEEEKSFFLGLNACSFYGFDNVPDLPYIKNMSE